MADFDCMRRQVPFRPRTDADSPANATNTTTINDILNRIPRLQTSSTPLPIRAPQSPHDASLLGLPSEIRTAIYEYVLEDEFYCYFDLMFGLGTLRLISVACCSRHQHPNATFYKSCNMLAEECPELKEQAAKQVAYLNFCSGVPGLLMTCTDVIREAVPMLLRLGVLDLSFRWAPFLSGGGLLQTAWLDRAAPLQETDPCCCMVETVSEAFTGHTSLSVKGNISFQFPGLRYFKIELWHVDHWKNHCMNQKDRLRFMDSWIKRYHWRNRENVELPTLEKAPKMVVESRPMPVWLPAEDWAREQCAARVYITKTADVTVYRYAWTLEVGWAGSFHLIG